MTYKKRPTTIGEVKKRIDEYFKSRLMPVVDKNGVPILDEEGKVQKKVALPYTLTGLALALGLESREELFTFEDKEINRYIRMSVMKVEEFAEEKLFSKEAFSGVKLFLSVNFDRWGGESVEGDEESLELPDVFRKWSV